jgi:hypothetical protein
MSVRVSLTTAVIAAAVALATAFVLLSGGML